MTPPAYIRATWVLGLLLAALSLAPSFAHLLEAPPRLQDWPARLWIEATVQHGQFVMFRAIGGPIDVAAVLVLAGLAFLERGSRRLAWTLAGAVLFALALGVWFAVVAPANTVLATWSHGPQPTQAMFAAVRDRWETGHAISAALKVAGFLALALARRAPASGGGASFASSVPTPKFACASWRARASFGSIRPLASVRF